MQLRQGFLQAVVIVTEDAKRTAKINYLIYRETDAGKIWCSVSETHGPTTDPI
jgi:hypothetical protein